jgi:hypothetical protein
VPANFQRFLPLILIIFLLLFVLPAILKHHSSSKGLTSKELSQETIATTTKVDALQQQFRTAHKGYTDSVADLLAMDHALGKALGDGVVIALDISTDKQTYYAQVASSVIQLTRAREGAKLISKSCLVVKSSSGVVCPQPPTKTTTTTTTTTSTTTTSSG